MDHMRISGTEPSSVRQFNISIKDDKSGAIGVIDIETKLK